MERNRVLQLALASLMLALVIAWLLTHPKQRNHQGVTDVRAVYVVSIVELEPIEQLRNGFRDQISKSKFVSKVRYVERNAQGDAGLIVQIASEIAEKQPDLVYVLGTPLAQAIQKRSPQVVVVQGAVTDPVEAGLANAWSGSGRRYAANSDRPPSEKIVSLIYRLAPKAKLIGYIYNPSEANSIAVLRSMKMEAKKAGMEVREFGVGRTTDIPIAVAAAVSTTDVLFIPPDNTVTSGIKSVIQVAENAKKPIFATTAEAVNQGALAGITTDFYTLGSEAADIAISIMFEGADPSVIPIALPKENRIVINRSTSQKLGIKPPNDMKFDYSAEDEQ